MVVLLRTSEGMKNTVFELFSSIQELDESDSDSKSEGITVPEEPFTPTESTQDIQNL